MHEKLVEVTRPIIRFDEYKAARANFRFKAEIAQPDDMKTIKRSSLRDSQRWLIEQLGPQAWGGFVNDHETMPTKLGFLHPGDHEPVYFDANRLWMAKWAGRVFFAQREHAAAFMLAWRGRLERKDAV